MSAARIAGGIVAIVTAALLIWVIAISFGPEEMVSPTVNVTTGQRASAATTGQRAETSGISSTNASPERILAARTQLMKFRTDTGPAAFPKDAAGDFHLNMDKTTPPNRAEAEKWLAAKPGGDLLQQRGDVKGISSLPYPNAASFQQPQGRDWRRAHNDPVRYGGGWLIFGTIFALAAFLMIRGRVKVVEGFSGKPVKRFGATERATHWVTAISFVLMGITGLIILYGKPLLIPLIGPTAIGDVSSWSAWLHMSFAVPFVLGILMMLGLWIAENLPTRADWEWLKQGGGFLHDTREHPPAYKFNAGQKMLFWALTLSGLVMLGSGISLMFPFYWFGYTGMQAMQLLHAALALLMIALIFAHVYIGTIGMEGAFDAMWSGDVDANWAKEHHRLWYRKIMGSGPQAEDRGPSATPAE